MRSNFFGFSHTILVMIHGLSFWLLIDLYHEECIRDQYTAGFLSYFQYFFVCGGVWSSEDFRITLLVKCPIYCIISYKVLLYNFELVAENATYFAGTAFGFQSLSFCVLICVGSYIQNLNLSVLVVKKYIEKQYYTQLTDFFN